MVGCHITAGWGVSIVGTACYALCRALMGAGWT